MKKIILTLILLLIGCQKENPIELIDDKDDSNLISIQTTSPFTDSLFMVSENDSCGNFDIQHTKFYAKLVTQNILIDRPLQSDSFTTAEAVFYDKNNPIRHNNRIIAFKSFDVGTLRFNAKLMNKFERKIKVNANNDSTIGYRYMLRFNYEHNNMHNWVASGNDLIDSFMIQYSAPSKLRVLNLRPSTIRISQPLYLKWECSNPVIHLYINAEEGTLMQRRLVPILHLKIQNLKGEITIPVKILELLPIKRYSRYLFSFTSENRITRRINGFSDELLLYSASVHSIYINVQP